MKSTRTFSSPNQNEMKKSIDLPEPYNDDRGGFAGVCFRIEGVSVEPVLPDPIWTTLRLGSWNEKSDELEDSVRSRDWFWLAAKLNLTPGFAGSGSRWDCGRGGWLVGGT